MTSWCHLDRPVRPQLDTLTPTRHATAEAHQIMRRSYPEGAGNRVRDQLVPPPSASPTGHADTNPSPFERSNVDMRAESAVAIVVLEQNGEAGAD